MLSEYRGSGFILWLLFAFGLAANPDQDIPEQWRSSLPSTWDNAEVRGHFIGAGNISTNYKWTLDQIMDGEGTLNVCMGWGANRTVLKHERDHLEKVYEKHMQNWLRWLPGYDNFPFEKVDINVVGWAASDLALIPGPMNGTHVYTGFTDDFFKMPTCDPGCSRNLHLDGNYTGCPGGPSRRFHRLFVIDPSWGEHNMGAALGEAASLSQWGWENVGSKHEDWPMLTHELGHTFGLPDYLDPMTNKTYSICSVFWRPENHPTKFVMQPGNGGFDMPALLTDMEGWMLRHLWSRFSRLRGWQKNNFSWPVPQHCDDLESDP